MKRFLLCVLIALCVLSTSAIGISSFANDPSCSHSYNENGICSTCGGYEPAQESVDNNLNIYNAGQFMSFAQRVNSGQQVITASLHADIDMSEITDFVPIGFWNGGDAEIANNFFDGIFDGNGYKIKNLTVKDTGEYNAVGLFGGVSGTIQEVTVENFTFIQTSEKKLSVGAVVGYMDDSNLSPKIKNVNVNGANITASGNVGGLVGYMYLGDIVQSSVKDLKIKSAENAGGLVGHAYSTRINESFVNTADITATQSAGGFIGCVEMSTVKQSYSLGLTLNSAEGKTGAFIAYDAGVSHLPTDVVRCISTYSPAGDAKLALFNCVTGCDESAFTNGAAAFRLGAPFGQNIDNGSETEEFPVIGGKSVYWLNNKFTNNECVHEYGADDICAICDAGKEPNWVNGVYQIETLSNYYWFVEAIQSGIIKPESDAILINDIGTEEQPVTRMLGDGIFAYGGNFDGNNKTVTVNISGLSCAGFIASAGSGYGGITIKNLTVKGKVESSIVGTYGTGGIIGRILKSGDVDVINCVNEATVKASERVGGIVGFNQASSSHIDGCINKGRIEATAKVGGILGAQEDSGIWTDVTKCANFGEVVATGEELGYAGGLVGYYNISEYIGSDVINCYSLADVTGTYSGLLIGYAPRHLEIVNCYGVGQITGALNNQYLIGGNVQQKNVKNVFTIGSVGADVYCTVLSEKEFSNGTVAVMLNNGVSDGTQVWYQNLGSELYPTFSGKTVYKNDDGTGYNDSVIRQVADLEPFESMTVFDNKKLTYSVEKTAESINPIVYTWYLNGTETNCKLDTYDFSIYTAGNYEVYCVASCGYQKLISSTVSFTIIGKELSEDFFVMTLPDDLVYSGTAKVPTVKVKDGVEGVGRILSIKYINIEQLDRMLSVAVDVGEYLVIIEVEAGGYYLANKALTVGRMTIIPCEHIYTLNGSQINYGLDEEGHWQECTHCGYCDLQTQEKHSGIDDGNCQTPVLCSFCDYAYIDGKTHELKIKADKDDENHVMECVNDGCDHEEDGYHQFYEKNQDEKYLKNQADCENPKTYYYSCECGRKSDSTYFEVGFYLGHQLVVDGDSVDEHSHLFKCTRENCDYQKESEHEFDLKVEDEKYVKAQADCLNGTQYFYSCSCGYKGEQTFFAGVALGHDFDGGQLVSNEDGHWKKCSRCDAESLESIQAHDFENSCDQSCDCGFEREVQHVFTSLVKDESGHFYTCVRCGEENADSHEAHGGGTPTCLAKGVCEDCGVEYGELGNHAIGEDGVCTVCAYQEPKGGCRGSIGGDELLIITLCVAVFAVVKKSSRGKCV